MRGWVRGPSQARRYEYLLQREAATLILDVAPFPVFEYRAAPGDRLVAAADARSLRVRVVTAAGKTRSSRTLQPSAARLATQARFDAVLRDTSFAVPTTPVSRPVLRSTGR